MSWNLSAATTTLGLIGLTISLSSCGGSDPSCDSDSVRTIEGVAKELTAMGIAGSYDLIDDCESGGAVYVNLESPDIAAIGALEKVANLTCGEIDPSQLDEPFDDAGRECSSSSATVEISVGDVNGVSRGQVWLSEQ